MAEKWRYLFYLSWGYNLLKISLSILINNDFISLMSCFHISNSLSSSCFVDSKLLKTFSISFIFSFIIWKFSFVSLNLSILTKNGCSGTMVVFSLSSSSLVIDCVLLVIGCGAMLGCGNSG